MREALAAAGYEELAAVTPAREAPSRLSAVLTHARRRMPAASRPRSNQP
jgi:hypothetical protein